MEAAYVFRVRFRLAAAGVRLDPDEFETVLRVEAERPPEPGAPSLGGEGEKRAERDGPNDHGGPADWLFFRDNLWRGEAGDEGHLRESASDLLGVDVTSVSFAELETDRAYLDALRAAIGANLDRFNDDDVDAVLHKYLGSSIRVTE